MTTISSRGMLVQKSISAPPWTRKPKRREARKIPKGCDLPISATAMPMNPAPSTEFRTRRFAAITELIAIIPASAPEISMAMMMILVGEIPAYLAAVSECPNARSSYPSRVFHIRSQKRKQARTATKNEMFTGAAEEKGMPTTPSMSDKRGSIAPSPKRALAGSIDPWGFSASFRR